MTEESENAKSKDWKVPMNMPGVKPEAYDAAIDNSRGSANNEIPRSRGQKVAVPSHENLSRKQQKGTGALPLHDEEIGGA